MRAALEHGRTRLLMLESPTNPRMQICDIAMLSRIAHEVPSTRTHNYKMQCTCISKYWLLELITHLCSQSGYPRTSELVRGSVVRTVRRSYMQWTC